MNEDRRNAPTLPAPPFAIAPEDVDVILLVLLADDFAIELGVEVSS